MNRTIEAKIAQAEDTYFYAKKTKIHPASAHYATLTLKTRGTTPEGAGRNFVNALNELGVQGEVVFTFENTVPIGTRPQSDDNALQVTDVDSHTLLGKTYRVTYRHDYRHNGNKGYTCNCPHFHNRLDVYNTDGEQKGGICKHIEDAIDEQSLGVLPNIVMTY